MARVTFELPRGECIAISEDDDRTAAHEKRGGFERESLAVWCSWIEPGRVYVDVGAYTGLYALIACRLGATAIAIEPMPAAVERIRANALINGLNPSIVPFAASNHSGQVWLKFNDGIKLTSGATVEPDDHPLRRGRLLVSALKIDALTFGSDVAAMKIDVEGHELAVIDGAMQVITRRKPRLLIETLTELSREAVHAKLPGYQIAGVLDGRNTVYLPT